MTENINLIVNMYINTTQCLVQMNHSKTSNLLITTRVLPHFNRENLTRIKSCIFEQLGCTNESQFLCIALQCMYKTLSDESMATIKTKAIQIAAGQIMHPYESSPSNSGQTICEYTQQQYNDPLCRLHGDIIDYFGTFLTKKESIELGYLNKQLYIETQKQSYLLKRNNDDIFIPLMKTKYLD